MIKRFLNNPASVNQLNPVKIAGGTHVGLVRTHNEDDYLYLSLPGDKISLLVVADGMGGHEGGELASYFTTEALSRIWRNKASSVESRLKESENLMIECIQKCNEKIFAINDKLQISRAMGTTVTAGLFVPGKLTIAHVGDSRSYLLRGGRVKQLTEDQTWVAKMVKLGNLSKAEAENHPLSHLLSNCVGASSNVQVDVSHHKRRVDDRYLFCTDGLYGAMPHKELQRVLRGIGSPQDTLQELIYTSLKGGGKDNITGIIAFDS
ncbi:MAG: protein phosphatase 2C domain-containing protein [Lentisphaeraceae bacterium]|nr:protein phosphatase 2C domain-containing protein [Lentisphaeraceae bacterium]